MIDVDALRPMTHAAIGEMTTLLNAAPLNGRVRVVESARVVYRRRFATASIHARCSAKATLTNDAARGIYVVDLRESEAIIVGDDGKAIDELLATTESSSDVVVDRSHGHVVFELSGDVDAWLVRLVDAAAIPSRTGCGTRVRFADVAAIVVRVASARVWVVVERCFDHYVCRWLAYAASGVLGLNRETTTVD